MKKAKSGINFFEKYLTIWVLLCMGAGILIGQFLSAIPNFLGKFEYESISIPIAILIWLMIYPMMMKVDWKSIKDIRKNPKGLFVTWTSNWFLEPFAMFGLAALFFLVIFKTILPEETARHYLTGAILLGAAPCTAMVFVWSHLTKGNPSYTVVQVATNNIILLFLFAPIVMLLLGLSSVTVPWLTIFLSVVLFVVIPLAFGMFTRWLVIKKKGQEFFDKKFVPKFNNVTIVGLLLTLVLIFSFQGQNIIDNPLHILLIAVPLVIHTVLMFTIAYSASKALKLPHEIAAPAALIGASNFFELAVAMAITLFAAFPEVALATIVGVLVEVPVMLILVRVANKTRKYFDKDKPSIEAEAETKSEVENELQ